MYLSGTASSFDMDKHRIQICKQAVEDNRVLMTSTDLSRLSVDVSKRDETSDEETAQEVHNSAAMPSKEQIDREMTHLNQRLCQSSMMRFLK